MSNGKVITIPVQFHDTAASYKTIIANLETELKKVKPGTAIYDSIADQLKKAKKLSSKIDLDLGENIHKESDISRLEKDFSSLYTVIESVNKSYKELSHTDLNINTENFGPLAEDYKKIRIELEKAQKTAKEAKSASIGDLFAEDANALKQFNKNDLSKAGVEVFSNLTKEAQKAEVAISQAADEIEALERKLESAKRSGTKETRFSQKIIGITKDSKATVAERRESLNAQLQSYFKKNGEWKANANPEQAEQIMRAFGMDQETINKILHTIPNRAKIIEEAVNKVTQKSFNTAHSEHYDAASKAKKEIEGITSKINKNKSIQADRQGELSGINQSLETLRAKLVNLGVVSSDGNSLSKLDEEIDELEKQVQELQVALLEKAPRTQDPNIPPPTAPLSQEFDASKQAELFKDNLKGAVKQWFGLHEIINMVKNGVRQAISDIQGLDKAMTNIAVVTGMSIGELWGKINEYMAIAKQYGVTTQGVYEVSQLYYQQGLSQAEVTELTTETLKLARVANMDYAKSADAMTVALRGFKMEMSEAARVTDVYSEVAAITASDQAELANAMSKTASSAASVGSSFENTTAMLAVMVETTRESAQNLGSALKSIISRYGEMKVGVTVDSEGEALDYNKVDTALKSVGISIKDAKGQFRDFDDVIFELSEKWDSLDKNTQRYIATIMAGNRQQSRFIALVDNWERLDEVSKAAADSQDAGLLQYAKTMDSLETKINNIKTSFQQFYMDILNGPVIGGALEFVNKIIEGFNKVSKITTTLNLASLIVGIKNIANILIDNMYDKFEQMFKKLKEASLKAGRESMENYQRGADEIIAKETQRKKEKKSYMDRVGVSGYSNNAWKDYYKVSKENSDAWGMAKGVGGITTNVLGSQLGQLIGNAIGVGLTAWGSKVAAKDQTAGLKISSVGTAVTSAMTITKAVSSMGGALGAAAGPIGLIAGALIGLVSYLVSVPSKLEKAQEDLANAQKEAEEANIKRAEAQKEAKDLDSTISKLKELQRVRYRSQEAEKEYMDACTAAAEQFPYLSREIDGTIDVIKNAEEHELLLAQARQKAAEATLDAAAAELKQSYKQEKVLEEEEKQYNFNRKVGETITYYSSPIPIDDLYNIAGGIDNSLPEGLKKIYDKAVDDSNAELLEWVIGEVSVLSEGKYNNFNDYWAAYQGHKASVESNRLSTEAGRQAVVKQTVERDWAFEDEAKLAWRELNGATESFFKALYDSEVVKNLTEADFDKETGKLLDPSKIDEVKKSLITTFEEFYKSLEESYLIDDFNEFYESADKGQLSWINLQKEFKKYSVPEEIQESLSKQYNEAVRNLQLYLNNEETGFKGTWTSRDLINIPLMYQSYIVDFNDYLKSKVEDENDSLTADVANNIIDSYKSVISSIYNSDLSSDLKAKAESILYSGDWTSITGIYDMFYALQDAGVELDGLKGHFEKIINNSSYNLVTESENLLTKVSTNFDKAAKAIKDAADGLNTIEEVVDMVNKLGVSFDDFELSEGKFYLKDPEKASKNIKTSYEEYIQQVSKQYDNYIKEAIGKSFADVDELNNLIAAEEQDSLLKTVLQTYGQAYLDSGFEGDFSNYIGSLKEKTTETINTVGQEYLDWYQKEAVKETASRKIDIAKDFASNLTNGLKKALSFEDVFDLGYNLQKEYNWTKERWDTFQSQHISQLPSGEFSIDFKGIVELSSEMDNLGLIWKDLVDSFDSIKDVENMWDKLGLSAEKAGDAVDEAAKVILKNIEAIKRANADDAMFNFMDQDMDSYADTYKSMAENMNDWAGVMAEATKTGKMGIADFWNISRTVSQSLEGSQLEAWNKYAQAVMATAKITEGGIVSVEGAIEGMGSGLEAMSVGMEKYYQDVANQQIKFIDAQIAALKAQEAAEKAISEGRTLTKEELVYTGYNKESKETDIGIFTQEQYSKALSAIDEKYMKESGDVAGLTEQEAAYKLSDIYLSNVAEALKKGLDVNSVEIQQMIRDSSLAEAGVQGYEDTLAQAINTNQILADIDANVAKIAGEEPTNKNQNINNSSNPEYNEEKDTDTDKETNQTDKNISELNKRYEQAIANSELAIEAKEVEISKLKLQLSEKQELEAKVIELETLITTLNDEIVKTSLEIQAVQKDKSDTEIAKQKLEAELLEQEAEVNALNEKIISLEVLIATANDEFTKAQLAAETARQEKADLELALSKITTELIEQEQEVTALKAKIIELEALKTATNDELTKAQLDAETALNDKLNAEEVKRLLEVELLEQETELNNIKEELATAKNTITGLKAAKADLEALNSELLQKNAELTAQLAEANKKLAKNLAIALKNAGKFDKYDEETATEEEKERWSQGAIQSINAEIEAGADVADAVRWALSDLFGEGTYAGPEDVSDTDIQSYLKAWVESNFALKDGKVASEKVQALVSDYLATLQSIISSTVSESANKGLPPEVIPTVPENSGEVAAQEYTETFTQTVDENPPTVPVQADSSSANKTVKALINNINNSKPILEVGTKFVIDANGVISDNKGGGPYTVDQLAEIWTKLYNNGGAQYAGNVSGLALYNGTNLANKTLVGELGPELAVYDNMYHLLGQNGAEFVNLPDDAIVFNHRQTEGIIRGQAGYRGKALVNGNVSGPAYASGTAAAIQKLEEAKAMWQSIADMGVNDLLNSAKGGGGGGGNSIKAHIEDLEEWYNLLRQISNLEQKINNLVAERVNITDGHEYLRNLRDTQALLEKQVATQQILLYYQEKQLKLQAEQINNNKFWSQFLTVDEDGLLQYKQGNEDNGGKGALSVLQQLNEMSGKDQLKYIEKMGYSYTDTDGKKLKGEELVAMFFKELQAQIDAYDDLYDTVNETTSTLEELETSIEEVNKEIHENQLNLETAIYDAIVEQREKEIEQLQEQNELIKEANEVYISGIKEAISNEREMYQREQDVSDREQLQRRLALLRMSGGSASEIADLEAQLDETLKNEYFTRQEESLQAIQEASDKQIERMDTQIRLMEENLEYEKEMGLLWNKVYEILADSEDAILQFISGNNSEFFEKSSLAQQDALTEWSKMIGIYKEDQYHSYYKENAKKVWDEKYEKEYKSEMEGLDDEQRKEVLNQYSSVYANARLDGMDKDQAAKEAWEGVQKIITDYKNKNSEPKDSSSGSGSGSSSSSEEKKTYSYVKITVSAPDGHGKPTPTSTTVKVGNSFTVQPNPDDGYSFDYITYNGTKKSSTTITPSGKVSTIKIEVYYKKTKYGFSLTKDGKKVYDSGNESFESEQAARIAAERLMYLDSSLSGSSIDIKKFATGGLADYTGLAQLDGTPSRPEAVLNSKQTKAFMELVENYRKLAQFKNPLVSYMNTYGARVGANIAGAHNNDNSNNVTVAPGAVQIAVAQLNDKYDIEELANDVMNRMVVIANKATNRGVNRR